MLEPIKSCTKAMDTHLIRLCVEHNPYQLGKTQWEYIVTDMKQTFKCEFLLRTLKERAQKLIEKYTQEQLRYKTGTEEEHTELGELLQQVVGYIEANEATINQQTNEDTEDVVEENNEEPRPADVTPRRTQAARRHEKQQADMERDVLLRQAEDVAPEPHSVRKKRTALLPEDELIKRKQEQDHELELKRIKLEERRIEADLEIQRQKVQLERDRLELEREKLRITAEEHKRQDIQQTNQHKIQQQMHDLFLMMAKKYIYILMK